MASVVNTGTLQVLRSVNTPDYAPPAWQVISESAADAIAPVPQRYRKWVTDHVEEMTVGEKAAVDAAQATADDDARMSQLNARDVLAAVLLVVRDEFEVFAGRIDAMRDAVATANNLGDAKTAAAAIPDAPVRTVAQIKAAVRARLETISG